MREVRVRTETGKVLRILTNDLDAPAHEIADLYKRRWMIELFFRWVKQTLRITRFIGTSENAVRIQIAVALIVFLLLRLAQAAQTAAKPARLRPPRPRQPHASKADRSTLSRTHAAHQSQSIRDPMDMTYQPDSRGLDPAIHVFCRAAARRAMAGNWPPAGPAMTMQRGYAAFAVPGEVKSSALHALEERRRQVALAGAGENHHDEKAGPGFRGGGATVRTARAEPEEMPQRMPSCLAAWRAVSKAASLLTGMISSMIRVLRIYGDEAGADALDLVGAGRRRRRAPGLRARPPDAEAGLARLDHFAPRR